MNSGTSYVQVASCGDRLVAFGDSSFMAGFAPPPAIGSAGWHWDGRRLTAATCRYGVRPLYYWATDKQITLSPSIPELIRHGAPGELDLTALGVFLRFGSFLGEDTPFRAIRAMPPGGQLIWDGRLSISGGPCEIEPRPLDRPAALAHYGAVLQQAVERSAGRTSLVPLSGGRDSRHIAFAANRLGRVGRCITVRYTPPKTDEDLAIAAAVSQAMAVPHVVLAQRGARLDNERRAILQSNFAATYHGWMEPLNDYFSECELDETEPSATSPVLDGLAGDVLSAGLFLTPERLSLSRSGDINRYADHLLGSPARLDYLAEPGLMPMHEARSRMAAELERHRDAANPVASFFFWNRTRRCIAQAPFGVLGKWRVHCPYLDPAVFDFLLGLPPEMFLDQTFHTEAIHRSFPEYAHIPFETKLLPPVRDPAHFRRYGQAVLRDLWQSGSPILDKSFCTGRLGHLAVTGSTRYLWVALICVYLDLLQEAGSVHRATGSALPVPDRMVVRRAPAMAIAPHRYASVSRPATTGVTC